MGNKKRICFDLVEFKEFFTNLELNCDFNEVTGDIEGVDGLILKGIIKGDV